MADNQIKHSEMKLTAAAQKFATRLRAEWSITDEPGLTLVDLAAQASAELEEARRQVARDGITIRNRFGVLVPHPAITIQGAALRRLLAALKMLDLDLESVGEEAEDASTTITSPKVRRR